MTDTTLHVTVESTADFLAAAREDIQRIQSGEDIDDQHVVSLPDVAALERLLNSKNVELLRAIAQAEPQSMRAAARAVDRDVKNVSTALNELAELGLVRFEQEGAAKRPVVWYDAIDVDLPIGGTSSSTSNIAPA